MISNLDYLDGKMGGKEFMNNESKVQFELTSFYSIPARKIKSSFHYVTLSYFFLFWPDLQMIKGIGQVDEMQN